MDSLQGQLKNSLAEVIFHWVICVKLLKKSTQKHAYGQSTGTVKNGVPEVIFHRVICTTTFDVGWPRRVNSSALIRMSNRDAPSRCTATDCLVFCLRLQHHPYHVHGVACSNIFMILLVWNLNMFWRGHELIKCTWSCNFLFEGYHMYIIQWYIYKCI